MKFDKRQSIVNRLQKEIAKIEKLPKDVINEGYLENLKSALERNKRTDQKYTKGVMDV